MEAIVGTHAHGWLRGQAAPPDHLEQVLPQVAESGIAAWEQTVGSAEEADRLGNLLKQHNLRARSVYDTGEFHTPRWEAAAESVLQRARLAKPLGVTVVNVSPDPAARLSGNADYRDKDDDALEHQAVALQSLGERLSAEGMQLAYHARDLQMRLAAREFHHMMVATDPRHVGLCLDAHWIYRGAGNSQIALYDVIDLYADRIRSLHVRQSHHGAWTEALGDGDIDYVPLAQRLREMRFAGPVVIDLAAEDGTPETMSPLEAHRRSREWVREVFGV